MLTKKEYRIAARLIDILLYKQEKWDLTSAEDATLDALFNLRREYRASLPDGPEWTRVVWLINQADISKPNWATEIIDSIDSRYARGYLFAHVSAIREHVAHDAEAFRKVLLDCCEHDIWK